MQCGCWYSYLGVDPVCLTGGFPCSLNRQIFTFTSNNMLYASINHLAKQWLLVLQLSYNKHDLHTYSCQRMDHVRYTPIGQ